MSLRTALVEAIANYPARDTNAKRGRKVSKTGSQYAVARDSGICQSAISMFVRGRRGLSLNSLEALCKTLGLELQPKGLPGGK